MPKFEKLSDAEAQNLGKRRQTSPDLTEYLAFLDGMTPGQWGRLTLGDGESQRTVKRRLTVASKQRAMEVKYRRDREGVVLLQIVRGAAAG